MHDRLRWRWAGAGLLGVGLCLWAIPGAAQEVVSARAALDAGDRVQVAGTTLMLETEIWADSGAPARPGPEPATVILRMTGMDAGVPSGVRMDGLWYVNGGAVSAAVPLGEAMSAPEGEVIHEAAEVIDADGDDVVDVLIRVRDHGGNRHLIKAASQPLRRF